VAINELLAHPVMAGNAQQLVDILMTDENSPLNSKAIAKYRDQCQEAVNG
jgi:hypothetical protein